jgi:predicted DNA-binding transcriptional regulator AlpA
MLERMLLVIDEVVGATGISRSQVYKAMDSGRLKFKVVAGRRRVKPADMRTWIGLD